ncbi:MAG TPA: SAM-dependent methyltransferase, partial [Methylomirabilota bacterium]|nr:SAM-dependent methyltransferase [Methylomirabilota bacterium]
MTVTTNDPATAEARRDNLAGRLMAAALGALDLQAVYLGDRLGLYRALAEGGSATSGELAQRAGIHPRYAREWLEHQAVGGIVDVDDESADPDTRRFSLPDGHAAVLLDPDSPWLVAPVARFLVGSASTMPAVLGAYRTGKGVDWADYGADVVEAQEGLNRPQFANYVGDWIS